MELTDLYFAYGADLDLARMRIRAGEVQVLSPARLAGFRLAFFGYDHVWDSGMETLVRDEKAETWGVLYRLRPLEWERLDLCMGATLDGTGAYFHYPVEVTTENGETHLVRTYRKSTRGEARLPSGEFMAHVAGAARARGLPPAYQSFLSSLPSIAARYPVPRREASQRHHLHVI